MFENQHVTINESEVSVFGVRIAYQETMSACHIWHNHTAQRPTLVFLHCWCSNKSSFKYQITDLSNDYRCISIDLPGHGLSSKPQLSYTIMLMAEIIEGFLQKLDLDNIFLVGHGLGGAIALEAAHQSPELFSGLCLISPVPFLPDSKLQQDILNGLKDIKKNGFRTFFQKSFYQLFFAIDDPVHLPSDLKSWATKMTTVVPDYVGVSTLEALTEWAGKPAVKSLCDLPLCLIFTDITITDLSSWLKYAPQLRWAKTLNGSHYCHLAAARETNTILRSFAASLSLHGEAEAPSN